MASLAQEAIDRLYIAAHRAKGASGTGTPAAEENLVQAVREALNASVSEKKIQQITGLSKDRIHALRAPVVPRPRAERTLVARPRPVGPPVVWPEWVGENLAAIKRSECATPRIRIVSGGLPGLGKRR